MSHFARVQDGVVVEVLVIEQDVVDSGHFGDPASFIQCSYNTKAGVHYDQNGKPDGGVALRGNYPGPGWTYDKANDVFYAPQPYPSWALDKTWTWQPPVAMPTDGKPYAWDEPSKSWVTSP